MTSVVVHQPPQPHRCRIEPDMRRRKFTVDGKDVFAPMAVDEPPGTVRACTECGRTWVAYRLPPQAGYAAGFNVRWRLEGRLARWWRARRQLRAAAERRERSEPPKEGTGS